MTIPDQPVPSCGHTAGPCRTFAGTPVAQLRAGLRAIVVPPAAVPADALVRPINADLSAVLVVGGVVNAGARNILVIPRHTAHLWGMSDADLWELAIRNLGTETTSEQVFPTAGGDRLRVVMGGSWHGAAQFLRLAEVLGDPLPHGALVTFPSGNAICAIPIRSRQSFDAVRGLMEVTDELLARDGFPWRTDVLWWHAGQLETINAVIDGPNVRMRVPDRCKAMLNTLS